MIKVSVQYDGGLLPDNILLTLCDYIGEPFYYHEERLCNTAIFDMLRRFGCVRYFLKKEQQ